MCQKILESKETFHANSEIFCSDILLDFEKLSN